MAVEAAGAEKVFTVNFDPADIGRRAQKIAIVPRAQPDPGATRRP